MDRPGLTVVLIPVTTLIAPVTRITMTLIAASRSGRGHARGPLAHADALKWTGAHDAAPAGYLYVPCARDLGNGYPAGTRRWVQQVPIVRKTATLIYYTSDSWDRRGAVVSPGCISREQFETDTRCHDNCPHGGDPCRCGYPAGVIPIPGDRHRPGPGDRLFFATREAAEDHLRRGERERAERAAPQAPPIAEHAARKAPPLKELRRAMADAHPDRGGTAEQFIQAHRRYRTALRAGQAA